VELLVLEGSIVFERSSVTTPALRQRASRSTPAVSSLAVVVKAADIILVISFTIDALSFVVDVEESSHGESFPELVESTAFETMSINSSFSVAC
jgi:hypothetical protein